MTITLEKINRAREMGASDDQIIEAISNKDPEWRDKIFQAREIGASSEQIIKALESKVSNVKPLDTSKSEPEQPGFFGKLSRAFRVGSGQSVTGLIQEIAGEPGPKFMEEPGFLENIAATAGTLFGDLPYIGAGATLGGSAGGAIGGIAGSVVPGAGTVAGGGLGATVGGTAGALAFPEFLKSGMREYLKYRSQGHDISFGEFLGIADRVASDTFKEGVNGLILGNIGKVLSQADKIPGLSKLLQYKPARKAAEIGLETAALGTLPAISEGRLPKANDFATGLALALGFKLPNVVTSAKSRYEKYIKDNKIAERELTNDKISEISEMIKSGIPENEALNRAFSRKQVDKVNEASKALEKPDVKPEIQKSIDDIPGNNKKKLAQKALDEGHIQTPEHLNEFLDSYEAIYDTIPGDVKGKNRKFMNLFKDRFNQRVSPEAESANVKISDQQKLESAVTNLRQARINGDKSAIKKAQKQVDFLKKKVNGEKTPPKTQEPTPVESTSKELDVPPKAETPIATEAPIKVGQRVEGTAGIRKGKQGVVSEYDGKTIEIKFDDGGVRSGPVDSITKQFKLSASPKPLAVKVKPEKKSPEPITEDTGKGATEQLDFTPNRSERIIKATNRAIEVIKNPKEHIVKTGQAINEGVFNFLAPLERLEKDIPIEDRPSVFIDRALSANSTINSIIENGIFSDITGQLESQGLKDAYGTDYVWKTRTTKIKEPNEASLQELSVYRTARQALKRQSEGKKTGIDTQQAHDEVARLGAKYEPIANRIREFQRNVTSRFGKNLLGQDGIAYWNKDYYSPMARVMDTGNDAMLSSNALEPKKPWYKFKGSSRKIIDPKESDLFNAAMLIQNDLKNDAVLKYRKGVIEGKLPGKIVKAKVEEIPEPIRRELEEKGLDFTDEEAVKQATKLYNQTRVNSFNPSNTTLRGWLDGKPFEIIVPEEVGRVFKGIEPQQRPYYARFFDFFNRAFNKQFRVDPQKFFSILSRDLLNATIWGRSGVSPRNAYDAMGEAIFGSDAVKMFYQEGGDAYVSRYATRLERTKAIDEHVTPGYEGPVYPLNKFMDFMRAVGKKQDAMAIAVPFTEYMNGIKKYGDTPAGRVKAMYDAKRVTYNPNRKGGSRIVRELAPFINWFNISLQDLAMNAHNLKRPEVWARAASIVTLPTLALKFANEGNPDYDDLTMEDKLGYWHIFVGDTHYRIALPWLMGTLFKVIPEAMYESAVKGNHKEALDGVFNNFVDQTTGSLNPILRTFVVTSTGKTPAEWFGFRTKAPEVVPKRLQSLPPEHQYTTSTSQVSRGIGRALGISPMIADRVAQELGGTLSKRTLNLIDEVVYQTGLSEDKRPEKLTANYVSIGNFITDSTPNRTRYTEKFYELWHEYENTKAAIKFGVPDKSLDKYGSIAKMKKHIDRSVREYRDIEQSNIDPHQKKQALKSKQIQINDLYKEAVLKIENH